MNALPIACRIFRNLCVLFLAGCLCSSGIGTALADSSQRQTASRQLARIETLIAEAEFETALRQVNSALAQPDNAPETVGRLYELQGMLHLYLGNTEAALDSFKRLLRASPQYRMHEDVSPKMQALFEEAREQMAQELSSQLKLAHPRPHPTQPGVPIKLEIRLEQAPDGVQAKLFYRRTASAGYSSTLFIESDDNQRWMAIVPTLSLEENVQDALPAGLLEYFIEVRDPAGSLLAIAGKREAPLIVPLATEANLAAATSDTDAALAPGESSAWYQKWWVWTIVGVVVAGAVTGTVIYALSNQSGTVPITVTLE